MSFLIVAILLPKLVLAKHARATGLFHLFLVNTITTTTAHILLLLLLLLLVDDLVAHEQLPLHFIHFFFLGLHNFCLLRDHFLSNQCFPLNFFIKLATTELGW